MIGGCARRYEKKYFTQLSLLIPAFVVFFSILSYASIVSAAEVTLAWDANTESDLTGYKIYCRVGFAPSKDSYDQQIVVPLVDLANPDQPEYEVDNVSDTKTTFFAVTAYNDSDDESGISNVVSYTEGNLGPTASFTANPISGYAPVAVSFNASSSSDPDGTIVSYSWAFGDGATGTGVSPSHTYTSAGTYTATLTVTDDGSASGSATRQIQVSAANLGPTASFTANPISGYAPVAVSFNASSSSDPDGTIVSYSWAFGDGATGTGVSPSHTYTSAGTYTVRLTVTDNDITAERDSTSMTITALDPPASNLAPDKPVITSPYYSEMECDLLASIKTEPFSDPDGDTHSKSRWQIVKKQDSSVVLDITSSKNFTEFPVPHAVLDRDTTYNVSVQFYDAYSEASEWSDPVEFTTTSDIVDFDDDGIPDDREVDDTIDLNDDGIPDNNQPDEIKCVESAAAGHVAICVSKISVSIDAIEALETVSPSEILDKKNKPNSFVFGLASYRLRVKQLGGIAIVRIYYSEDIAGAKIFYMYDSINGWQDYTEHVIFNEDGRSVTVELKDGGHGDSDGVANGIIVDPGGVTTSVSTGGLLDSGAFKSGCFIATAAFGSYVEPHVKLLREFRDQYLLTNSPGRGFIKVYYKYGPFAADYIREHDWLKPIVRVLLIPLVGISYILIKTSLATKILTVLLMIISMSCKKPRQGERLFV